MTWLISKALMQAYENSPCSPGPEAESLADTCSDGKPSALLNGTPTQLAYLPPDKMTEFSRLSRFGMMFKPLTESRGEDLLMWFRGDFLVKTYPAQERVQELKEADQVCGNTWQELSVKYDLATHSWRTHLCLWDEALQWSSVTLPKWGMTANGALFQHQTLERPINETGSGCWPTPCARDHHPNGMKPGSKVDLGNAVKMIWPTPTAHNAKEAAYPSEFLRKTPTLAATVAMRKFPTPQSADAKNAVVRHRTKSRQVMLGGAIATRNLELTGGMLSPMWVEWLMGWPVGWTDLKPLEMDKFQQWQQQHSASLPEAE